MSEFQVLLIAGTHGNEVNASWLFDEWNKNPEIVNTPDIRLAKIIGNPLAKESCRRYLDRDLNRSFCRELWGNRDLHDYEIKRAKEIFGIYGPEGKNPCQIAFDFHSTTSSMGSSLVVYGRRPADLALASLIQFRLGLPIYLHEDNPHQTGFLVETWPCGIVIEIGPVPQGLLLERIITQTRITLETILEELVKIQARKAHFPKSLIIHRHIENIDFPRNEEGKPNSYIHKGLQTKNWVPIKFGHPLFESAEGEIFTMDEDQTLTPVFINEAAYIEKGIALGFTKREVWPFSQRWEEALNNLIFT